VIDNSRNRERLHRAIDALHLVSDDRQQVMQTFIHPLWAHDQHTIGRILNYGRTIDTLERILSELHALLDQPPGVGGSEPPRLVPRPVRPVDDIARPGLAVPGSGGGGSAAA
jgi:hypothetical protein